MKITGNVSNIELEDIKFTELKGVESKCSECLEHFEEGDKIVAISVGEYRGSSITLSEGIYFVKTKVAGDFLTRFLDTLQPKSSEVIIVENCENMEN